MTDIPFRQIPNNLRVPLFYAEVDPSHANTALPNLRALLIGTMAAAGLAAANVPALVYSPDDARTQYGQGSILAAMVDAYRKNDPTGEVWALPLAEAGGAAAATGNIGFAGPATAAGVLSLYIAGFLVAVPVTANMTAAQLATAVAAAINANADLPVTAAVDGVITTQVNITAKLKGLTGNDIDMRVNYLGSRAGEVTPAGITSTITALSGGATNPTLTTALANLQDLPFEFIACAYSDAASLTALAGLLNDTAGRWSWSTQIFGHWFVAYRGTYSGLTTFGVTLNDQHGSVLGMNDTPTAMWRVAAALAAQAAVSVRADPSQPIREVTLQGVLAPPIASRFSLGQRNTLLFDGISTFDVAQDGSVVLEKLITTYQKNSFNVADNAYLDAETLFTLAAVLRELQGLVTSRYGRTKLAADGAFLPPGSAIVTPKMIKADLVAKYRELEQERGWVQQSAVFAANLIVQKNSANPNRVDVLYPAILIDRLDVFALLAQFRLS
jgi:phage tail sheath gpL-like